MFKKYKNVSGNSGIDTYQIGDTYIIIKFLKGEHKYYKYTYQVTGKNDVEQMKLLAGLGIGLNRFIERRGDFEDKW